MVDVTLIISILIAIAYYLGAPLPQFPPGYTSSASTSVTPTAKQPADSGSVTPESGVTASPLESGLGSRSAIDSPNLHTGESAPHGADEVDL